MIKQSNSHFLVILRLAAISMALLAFNSNAGAVVPAEREQDIKAIKAITEAWISAYQSGDIETLMKQYTDETAIFISNKVSLRGLDEIRSYFEPRLGLYEFELKVENEEYLFHGDLIIDFSLVWINGRSTETGETFTDAVRSMIIFRHQPDTGWRIYRDMDQHTTDTQTAD